tara:strand:- start:319 stop:426 length:108 start_codon:yes stop_codon:yes gene_type:complete
LGKKGKCEMFAIGLNPSDPDDKKLDPTPKNIEEIA